MKRVWATMVTAAGFLASGCGVASYESRLERTLADKRYEQKLDGYLQPAAQGKFKELSVWLRPPKPLEEGKLLLTEQPGMYDLTATFLGAPSAAGPATENAPAPAALPPLRLHVLGRVKPKKGTPKKGEPAPEPNAATRGNFVADVRALLATDLGPEPNPDKSPTNDKKKETAFRRLIYQGASGNTVQVYFAEANKGETEVALIYDIPPPLLKAPIVTTGIDLSLNSFAMGNAARKLFNSGGKPGSTEGGGAEPAF